MEFKTKRLQIRELNPKDAMDLHRFSSLPNALPYEAWGPFSLEEAQAYIANASAEAEKTPRINFLFGISKQKSPVLVGLCSLEVADGKQRGAKIGYSIHPNHRKRGLASEAALGLIDFAKSNLKVRHFYTSCDSENKPSLRVLEKCGFTEIGMNAELEQVKGRFRDMLLFEMG